MEDSLSLPTRHSRPYPPLLWRTAVSCIESLVIYFNLFPFTVSILYEKYMIVKIQFLRHYICILSLKYGSFALRRYFIQHKLRYRSKI